MEFTLKVTDKDVEVIGQALAELPFKSVSALVGNLQGQINEQVAASQGAAPAVDTPPEDIPAPPTKSKK